MAFYVARPTQHSPLMDGKLDDPGWAAADAASESYEYFKATPGPGVLQTDFRAVYDDKGLYLGIVNHEKHMDKLKANRTERDDNLWEDDSVEIYFDPVATGVGYLKFAANSVATRCDAKRLDAANTFLTWNPEGWEAKAFKGKDFWSLELFFPWSVLGKKPAEGEIWMFDVVRYAYAGGTFVGTTWAPGGSYQTPNYFGYLVFQGKAKADLADTVTALSQKIAPPWKLPMDKGFWICRQKGQAKFFSLPQIIERKGREVDSLIRDVDAAVKALPKDKTGGKLRAEFAEVEKSRHSLPSGEMDQIRAWEALQTRAEDVYWRAMIETLLNHN